jgi:hypothetical protein
MNKTLKEVASTRCDDRFFNGIGGNNILIGILVLFVLFGCCGTNILGAGAVNNCCPPKKCCNRNGYPMPYPQTGFLGAGSGIWILLVLLVILGGSFGNSGRGNINTNVINVDTDRDEDEFLDI